jgi:hypothetical protein
VNVVHRARVGAVTLDVGLSLGAHLVWAWATIMLYLSGEWSEEMPGLNRPGISSLPNYMDVTLPRPSPQ